MENQLQNQLENNMISLISCIVEKDYRGHDITCHDDVTNVFECQKKCQAHNRCLYWSWVVTGRLEKFCYLKDELGDIYPLGGEHDQVVKSGPKYCPNWWKIGENVIHLPLQ